ncbi:NAD-dependent epimerase/dehydratase family protein [Bradyrhizobium sp. AUGA SZCCT0431]|uniref:NAD-dependent epimerase/dehydratase family protein n=1 Tax=Bradyrhizobium sp. AUGA SZCCT0431 TaxID=2807674 RepID=UPI001BA98AE8|nr:NAD-dependent epimerase/dehydratase family protein [Bradyrhizobium sp. AUGA SZCCT0431]MBR1147553.1 NAD-dependent epimerase/dehydratase family protein [Bradyrhizobium sp. AUGA SZCCT0431]
MPELTIPPERPRIALVTGGSGFVGGRLISHLLQRGWQVRALARSPQSEAQVRALGATPVKGSLGEEQALRKAMAGCDVVFHVAAHFKLWGEQALFDQVNVDGTRNIVNAAAATASVRRVVAVSAAAVVMGDPAPMVDVDETLPLQVRAFSPYGSSKAKGERVLLGANRVRPDLETVALRPPFVWGDGMPTLHEMVETVHAGRWQWVDGGKQAMSSCHVDNLCDALILAADRGRGGEAYFVADDEKSTLKGFISALLSTRGVSVSDKAVPFRLAWTMAGLMGAVWRLLRLKGQPPITRQMLRLIGKPFTIRTDKARADLGYAPRTTMSNGLAAMRSDKRYPAALASQRGDRHTVAAS